MKLRTLLSIALAALLPAIAAAQEARAIRPVNLRAGPDRDFPLVASFGPGTPLMVQGCTDGFGWCDVLAPNGLRGWVYAGNIGYPYQSAEVPVLGYGALIGIPIVTFAVASYWNSYYVGRPWYRDRHRWDHWHPRPVVVRPGPPPRPVRPLPGPRPPMTGGPGGHRPPPPIGRPPGDHRPPGVRPPGNHRPPPSGRPPGNPRPPQAGGGHRPPGGGGGGGGGHRPPRATP